MTKEIRSFLWVSLQGSHFLLQSQLQQQPRKKGVDSHQGSSSLSIDALTWRCHLGAFNLLIKSDPESDPDQVVTVKHRRRHA